MRGSTVLLFAVLTFSSAWGEDWPKYKRDFANSGHSAETGINSTNVSKLKTKWNFHVPGPISDSPAVATINGRSMVFIGDWKGNFLALNALTGTKIWSFQVDLIPPCNHRLCRIGSSPAVDVSTNMVFFGAQNAYVYALDASDGRLRWKKQLGDPTKGADVWSSPAVYNGMVYLGLASHGDDPCVAGLVNGYAESTGDLVWSFNTIDEETCPKGKKCRGAAVWSSVAIDDNNGIVYADTGNPGDSCSPAGPNAGLYPDSILALGADSGKLLGYRKLEKVDKNDNDLGSSPILDSSGLDDECTGTNYTDDWVTVMSKYGAVFTIARNATGLTGRAQGFYLDHSGVIATPSFLPEMKVKNCSEGKQRVEYVNKIHAPGSKGGLYIFSQGPEGKVDLQHYEQLSKHPLWAAPAVIEDVVLFGSDGYLKAVRKDGKVLLRFRIRSDIYSGVAISNGRVYFGAMNGHVYCLSVNGT